MYINYKTKGDALYAMAVKSVRNGKSVSKEKPLYLGRVLDKDNHIFKSRERGIFTYDVETNTFGKVSADYAEPAIERKNKSPKRPNLIVSFGDVFLLDAYIKKSGFAKAIDIKIQFSMCV